MRLGDMLNLCELPQASLKNEQAKDADRLEPKWHRSRLTRLHLRAHGQEGCRCRGRS